MKHRALALGFVVALVMLLSMATAAFADGETTEIKPPPLPPKATICVDGYVINHRELPVDGTKTNPPLVVEAIRGQSADNAEALASRVLAEVGKDGYFKFKDLEPGEWSFQLQLPEEWEGIAPRSDENGLAKMAITKFDEKKGCYRLVFKVRRLITIVVVKWEEQLDGIVKRGVGWEITATPVKDPFVKAQTKLTSADGIAEFSLTPGKWIISEKVKPGYAPVTPAKLTIDLDQYGPIGARDNIVFKNKVPACYASLPVYKYGYGTGANGPELLGALGGWKVTLSRADGTMVPVTLLTDGEGRLVFKNLAPGVYKLTETIPPGWKMRTGDVPTNDGAVVATKNPFVVVINTCGTQSPVEFYNEETAGTLRIFGKKLFKAWVPPYKGQLVGLADWLITAKLVGTDEYVEEYTDALGQYEFTQEELGKLAFPGATLEVCEEDRTNWIHVTPKCIKVKFPYPVPEGYKGVEVNFINVQDPPVAGLDMSNTETAPVVAGSCATYHTVAKGDTLAKIAGAYGSSMRGLVQANAIRNADMIYLGQKLCIP